MKIRQVERWVVHQGTESPWSLENGGEDQTRICYIRIK